jgi:hypothetical protein
MTEPAISSKAQDNLQPKQRRRESRYFWILTAYAISGLALFGVLAYYISTYVAKH